MAITKFNYVPGAYEAITDEPLDDSPVLNTWYYFEINGWSHVISDVVLKQGGTPLPGTAYELTVDTKYTNLENGESGKTLYGLWRIVDGTYDLIATTVSGNNFGSYVDNEAMLNTFLKKTGDDLEANTVTFTEDNEGSGSALTLDLDDSNMFYFDKTSGTTIGVVLTNGGSGTYILRMKNSVGSAVTVTFATSATVTVIKYVNGASNFTLPSGKTGLFTMYKSGTTVWVTYSEFNN